MAFIDAARNAKKNPDQVFKRIEARGGLKKVRTFRKNTVAYAYKHNIE